MLTLDITWNMHLGLDPVRESPIIIVLGQLEEDFTWLSLFSAHLIDEFVELLNS